MTDAPIRFEAWAPAREAPPPRSRLYNLEPIGIGTPEVEKQIPQSLRQNSRQGKQPCSRCCDSRPRAFLPQIFQELLKV